MMNIFLPSSNPMQPYAEFCESQTDVVQTGYDDPQMPLSRSKKRWCRCTPWRFFGTMSDLNPTLSE